MKERDRLAALGQMAAGLAHEIRNPLGSIKGPRRSCSPSSRRPNDGSIKEFLDIIVEEVNRLNKIVSQFLDYARPYRGEQRPLDVNDVVRKTLPLLEKEEEQQGRDRHRPGRGAAAGARGRRAAAAGVPEPVAERDAGDARGGQAAGRRAACGARPGGAPRRPSWRCASATPGWASPPATSRTCSSRSSPPRRRGPGWGCPSASASSRTTAAPSRCAPSRGRGRRSRCCCRSRPTPTPPTPRPRSGRRRCPWSATASRRRRRSTRASPSRSASSPRPPDP